MISVSMWWYPFLICLLFTGRDIRTVGGKNLGVFMPHYVRRTFQIAREELSRYQGPKNLPNDWHMMRLSVSTWHSNDRRTLLLDALCLPMPLIVPMPIILLRGHYLWCNLACRKFLRECLGWHFGAGLSPLLMWGQRWWSCARGIRRTQKGHNTYRQRITGYWARWVGEGRVFIRSDLDFSYLFLLVMGDLDVQAPPHPFRRFCPSPSRIWLSGSSTFVVWIFVLSCFGWNLA